VLKQPFDLLQRDSTTRLAKVQSVLQSTPRADRLRRNVVVTWCVIELDNLIINMQREFLVSSLMWCRTAQGLPVRHNIGRLNQQDAARYIISILEPKKYKNLGPGLIERRDEAVLRNPAKVMQVATAASMSNIQSVVNALSLNSSAFTELSIARHFFAHRNSQTATKVVALAAARGMQMPIDAWMVVDIQVL